MKPFHQGKLDVFCAIYAVLNGLRLTHGLTALKAREILNDTLLASADNKTTFKAVLNQETDYIPLVDAMLEIHRLNYPLHLHIPFTPQDAPTPEEVRRAAAGWLDGTLRRAIVFRFFRHLRPEDSPINRHWSTVSHLEDGTLCLYDASHEQEAVRRILPDEFVTRREDICLGRLLYIEPHSLRCIGRRQDAAPHVL